MADLNARIVQRFIDREINAAQGIVDVVPVFGRRYRSAVDRLEELEAVQEAFADLCKARKLGKGA